MLCSIIYVCVYDELRTFMRIALESQCSTVLLRVQELIRR